MVTNYEELFDDIHNNYIEKNPSWLNKFDGRTEADLKFWLKHEFGIGQAGGRTRVSDKFARGLVNTNKAQDLFIGDSAVKAELKRPVVQRRVDERTTAKDTRPLNKKNFSAWRKNPGRFDLKGIDTKTKSLLAKEISFKINAHRERGETVKRFKSGVIAFEDNKGRFRNVLNGRFTKKES